MGISATSGTTNPCTLHCNPLPVTGFLQDSYHDVTLIPFAASFNNIFQASNLYQCYKKTALFSLLNDFRNFDVKMSIFFRVLHWYCLSFVFVCCTCKKWLLFKV